MTSTFDTGVRTVRTIARAQAWFSRRTRAIGALFVLCAMVMLPGISHASGCAAYSPISITVGSGQTYTIDLTADYADCAYYGTTLTQTTSAHGTISNSNSNPAAHIYVYYTNNGDGATSDSFSFQDDVGNNIQVNVTILPAASAISITPTSFSFTGGTAVNTSLSASGGTGPYTYSVTAGALPTGLSLSSGGALTGTPSAFGNYSFTVGVVDSSASPQSGSQSYTGSVAPGNLTISPASPLTNATITMPYSVALSGNNGIAPYSFAITDPANLPPGITLSGGSLSGTPTATGTYNFHIAVTDSETNASGASSSNTVVLPYQLVVQSSPTITVTPTTVSNATVGAAYTPVNFTASGGTASYTYSVSAGSLPAGMSLSSSGTLSGTPTEAGPFNFTVQAKDANNFTGTTSSISMTVNAPTITVGPGVISNMQVGVPYSQQFTASGGTQGSGYTFAASGTVPVGLTLSSTGLLSGTPTSATSSASFTVTATDHSTGTGAPFSGSQGYTVSVAAPTLSISPVSGTTLTAATQGSGYSQAFTASGGTPNYNYQITGGTLPNGLSLSNGGQLSGTPTEAGTFNFNVTATDSSGGTGSPFTVSGSYTLDVQPIVPVANPVTINVPYSSTANVVSTSFSGGTPTSVAVASPASHGTATASGTTITYTPTAGYTGTGFVHLHRHQLGRHFGAGHGQHHRVRPDARDHEFERRYVADGHRGSVLHADLHLQRRQGAVSGLQHHRHSGRPERDRLQQHQHHDLGHAHGQRLLHAGRQRHRFEYRHQCAIHRQPVVRAADQCGFDQCVADIGRTAQCDRGGGLLADDHGQRRRLAVYLRADFGRAAGGADPVVEREPQRHADRGRLVQLHGDRDRFQHRRRVAGDRVGDLQPDRGRTDDHADAKHPAGRAAGHGVQPAAYGQRRHGNLHL